MAVENQRILDVNEYSSDVYVSKHRGYHKMDGL